MEWAKPRHSKRELDKAGKIFTEDFDHHFATYIEKLDIINNWRACHNYPLNTFKVTLRRYASRIDPNCLVAQRIKRLSSISHKLERFPTLRLSQMQDIGGCRAILSNIKDVIELVEAYDKSDIKHIRDDVDDYIQNPKESGYRGVHLIYKYNSDKKAPSIYNGLYIEIQVRSKLQHAWATAVETMGTFLKQPLKSSLGEEKWLRFFALMSSIIALKEGCPLIPNTPSTKTALKKELREVANEINAVNSLKMFGDAIKVVQQPAKKSDHFFLLKLEPNEQKMTITGFSRKELDNASKKYLEVEQDISEIIGADAVLVSVDSITALKRAYPNYFLDTQVFLEEVKKALK